MVDGTNILVVAIDKRNLAFGSVEFDDGLRRTHRDLGWGGASGFA